MAEPGPEIKFSDSLSSTLSIIITAPSYEKCTVYQNWKVTEVHFSDVLTVKLNKKYKTSRSDGFTWHNKIGAKPLFSNCLQPFGPNT